MATQKIFWATNVKTLRARKKLSQEELAARLNITRSKLNAHENGITVNPTAEDLISFSEYFKMSIDTLLKVDLQKLSPYRLRELEAGNDSFATGSKLRVLATTVDQANNENAEFVPVKAKAGYISGFNDPDFIAALPKFSLPNLPANKTYRMFPTKGDSMLPIPENCFVITEYIQDWHALKNDTLCVLILKSGGNDFVFKKVINNIKTEKSLELHSLNDTYQPYTVEISEVLEIWKYHSYISSDIPQTEVSIERIGKALSQAGDKLKGMTVQL